MVLLFDFTGYALRWDTDISWALLVGTNLLRSIPLIGGGLYRLVVGGVAIGPASVVRIYGWHVYGLTVVAIFILGWHLFRVRRDGGISSAVSKGMPAISRHELVWREMIALLVVSVLLLAIAIIFPPGLAPVANFEIPPAEAVAPWFFVWIQQLLRFGSPFLMGVLIPVLILVVLALLPYLLDNNQQGVGRWFNSQGEYLNAWCFLF